MVEYGLGSYQSPWVFEVSELGLAGFNFTVTDASTGLPVQGARCNIHAGLDGGGDADGGYTDANGVFGIDAIWFVPNSWSVSKEGYVSQVSNNIGSQIPVSLVSTAVIYTVNVLSGAGGSVNPSGFISVEPNADLNVTAYPDSGYVFDFWVLNGVNIGGVNPAVFLIDRDGITILASFKVGEEPPPNGDGWPVIKTEQVFDNIRLAPGLSLEALRQREKHIDTSLVLGGTIEYTVKLESSILTGCTYSIIWNGEVLDLKGFLLWEPFGTIKSGVVDIPLSKIRSVNVLTISLTHVPATNNVTISNVYVRFGYSSEPSEDPPWTAPFNWDAFISKYGMWIALGGAGIIVLSLMRPPGQPIIVIPGLGGKK